jgi:hypothetical protein
MLFFTKSILALILVALGLINAVVMLELLGRAGEKRFDAKRLRFIHHLNGYIFLLLYLFIAYLCIKIMRGMGGELPSRAALHSLLAAAGFFLLGLKLLIVRFYKKYYSMAVPMGIGVLLLLLTTTALSAGHYFTMRGTNVFQVSANSVEGDAKKGAVLFAGKGCADCHYTDSIKRKLGPGLKDLFAGDTLPVSGWKVTEENVRKQLKSPFRSMPSYTDLAEKELQALMAFLKSL